MSKLEKLINELCPNGVEWKALGSAINLSRGVRVVRSQLNDQGKYPVYQNSMVPLGYFDESNYRAKTTFIISAGAAGTVGYSDENFWAADDCYCLICPESLNSRYLYYALKNQQDYIFSQVRKASVPRIARDVVERIQIPIPPLPVQEEIVRILDNFTELTAELTAEQVARKKQYEYYRDSLLKSNADIPMKRLGDTCKMKSGKAIKAEMLSQAKDAEHPYPCFGGNSIRGYIAETSNQGAYPIIGRQGALCGNVNYATGEFYATEHAVVVESLGEYEQRYLFYLLTAMNLNQYKSQGAQPGLAVGNIENLLAPVPSLEQQRKVVDILDRFDTLCNDISGGLPAEIEARKKQYEYYRDKLLTFPKANVEV